MMAISPSMARAPRRAPSASHAAFGERKEMKNNARARAFVARKAYAGAAIADGRARARALGSRRGTLRVDAMFEVRMTRRFGRRLGR